jgi:hypothetical protein
MSDDSPIKVPSLDKYGITMTKEEVAEVLHLPRHIIPPLTRAGLLKPLGTSPTKYCVKYYSRDVLARQIVDVNWLDKIVDAMHKHWRKKNARKRAKQAGNQPTMQNRQP